MDESASPRNPNDVMDCRSSNATSFQNTHVNELTKMTSPPNLTLDVVWRSHRMGRSSKRMPVPSSCTENILRPPSATVTFVQHKVSTARQTLRPHKDASSASEHHEACTAQSYHDRRGVGVNAVFDELFDGVGRPLDDFACRDAVHNVQRQAQDGTRRWSLHFKNRARNATGRNPTKRPRATAPPRVP
jgi:hypothetical protein